MSPSIRSAGPYLVKVTAAMAAGVMQRHIEMLCQTAPGKSTDTVARNCHHSPKFIRYSFNTPVLAFQLHHAIRFTKAEQNKPKKLVIAVAEAQGGRTPSWRKIQSNNQICKNARRVGLTSYTNLILFRRQLVPGIWLFRSEVLSV
jgi:hypothetical protein